MLPTLLVYFWYTVHQPSIHLSEYIWLSKSKTPTRHVTKLQNNIHSTDSHISVISLKYNNTLRTSSLIHKAGPGPAEAEAEASSSSSYARKSLVLSCILCILSIVAAITRKFSTPVSNCLKDTSAVLAAALKS